MNLRAVKFEQNLRKLIRDAADPLLLKHKRSGTASSQEDKFLGALFAVGFFSVVAGVALAWLDGPAGISLSIAVLWTLLPSIVIASQWLHLETQIFHPVWQSLPVTPEFVRRHLLREFTFSFLLWPVSLGIAYAIRAFFLSERNLFSIAALTIGQSAMILALAIHLAAFLGWRRFSNPISFLLLTAGFIPFLPAARAILVQFDSIVTASLPTGWVLHIAHAKSWRDWIFALPILLFAATIPQSLRRIRGRHAAVDHYLNTPSVEIDDEQGELQQKVVSRIMEPVGPTEIADSISSRSFLREEPHPFAGWIERFAVNRLNARELAAMKFIWPFGPQWTMEWNWSARYLAILIVAAALTRVLTFGDWYLVAVFFVLGCAGPFAKTMSAPPPPAFRKHPTIGGSSPFFTAFPVGYDSLYRTLLKTKLVRVVVWSPLIVFYSTALGLIMGQNLATSAMIGARVALWCLGLQPVLASRMISDGNSVVRDFTPLLLIPVSLIWVVAAPLALVCPMSYSEWTITFAIFVLSSIGCERLIRINYRGKSVDLITPDNR